MLLAVLKIIIFMVCLAPQTCSVEGLPFYADHSPWGFHFKLLNPYFLLQIQGFSWLYMFRWYPDPDPQSMLVRGHNFLCSIGLFWITYNFSKSEPHLTALSFFRTMLRNVDLSVSLLSDKPLDVQQFAHSLLQRQPVTVHHVMFFWSKTTFCANGHAQLPSCAMSFRVVCWMVTILQVIYFFFTFLFQHSFSFGDCLTCSKVQSLHNFLFLMWLSLQI